MPRNRRPIAGQSTFQESLAQLLQIDFVGNARQFLLEHPLLLSARSISVLDSWIARAESGGEADLEVSIRVHRALLTQLWTIGVEMPLANLGSCCPEIRQVYHASGIRNPSDLAERVTAEPELRPRLAAETLRLLSDDDWAMIVLFSIASVSPDQLVRVVEYYPMLLEARSDAYLQELSEWIRLSDHSELEDTITTCRSFLAWLRQEINSGRLKLHKPHVWQLIVQYVNQPDWEAKKELLRAYGQEILSSDGIDEMQSYVESSFVNLLTEGDERPLVNAALCADLLERCCVQGVERAFSPASVVVLPPELWLLSGLLRIRFPSIRSFDDFRGAIVNNPEWIVSTTKVARLSYVGRSTGEYGSVSDDEIRPEEIDQIIRLAFVQFALRSTPETFVGIVEQGAELMEPSTLGVLTSLMQRAHELGRPEGAEAVIGLLGLLTSPHCRFLMREVLSLEHATLDALATNGARLATLLGGIAWMEQCPAEEPLFVFRDYPSVASPASVDLVALLLQRIPPEHEVARLLARWMPLLLEARDIGVPSFMAKKLADDCEPTLQAFYAWMGVSTEDQMVALVHQLPVLRNDEVVSLIEAELQSSQWSGEDEGLSSRFRYDLLLRARRAVTAAEFPLQRQIPNRSSDEYDRAASLIWTLETSVPAGLWCPVSRIDLNAAFFQVLDSWLEQVGAGLGTPAAEGLKKVLDSSRRWVQRFGPVAEGHDRHLEATLLALLVTDDLSDVDYV